MTAAIIHATSRPLVGIAAIDNPPPPPVLPTLNDITATTSFNIPLAEGALLVAPTGAMTAGSTYVITPNDGRVKVQGGAYVRGPSDWTTAGVTVFTVVETYTGVTGSGVSRTSTLTVTSVAPVVVVPGFATVVDAVGRNTRSGVKIGQLPAGATLSGTNATHFNVDALGQVTVSAAGQTAGLASSYNMTVVGGGSITTMAFNTLANTFTVTNATELEAAFNIAKATKNIDWKLAIPTGTTINSPAVLVAPQNIITRRYIELKNAMMDGVIVDDNSNLTPQDVDPKGFTSAGVSQYVGLNGKQAYNRAAVASVSGGSITIYCPTTLATGGAKMNAMIYAQDCRPLRFENIDFCLKSAVDMYDSKATAPTYVTREAVISVTAVSSTGGVTAVNFDDTGAGYPPGWTVNIDTKTATGSDGRFAGRAVAKADGTIDPTSFIVRASGARYTTASKLKVFNIQVWDPKQPADAPQFPAYNPVNGTGGLFYQFEGGSSSVKQEDSVPTDYSSFIFRGCRFGVGGRDDLPAIPTLRYNRTLHVTTHDRLIIEDCLWDGFWIAMGHGKWVRNDIRRCAFFNYTNDITDSYPTTPNIDPVATAAARAINPTAPAVLYTDLAASFRGSGYIFDTDNYCGRADQSSLLLSNSHSDYRQHGGGGDFERQNVLFAHNFLNMHCSSTYITTQGYFDNGNSAAAKKARVKFNFCAASTTNSIMFSYTDTSDPLNTLFENNFSNRTIYGLPDLGNGLDGIGGGINPIGPVEVATIRRNTIKEVWDMGSGNGGRIFADPADGIMKKSGSTTIQRGLISGGTLKPLYISDNYYISYLTPNTGAGNSYPEVFKGVNAIGQGPAFIWNTTLGFSGPTAGQISIGFHRWWEFVRDDPTTRSWTDWWAAVARGKADIQSIFTPQAGSGADGRHCFPAEAF